MSRVLVLSLLFPPDNVSTAHIMGDLALDLKSSGHDVTVITATPHYNRDAEAERAQPLRRVAPLFYRSDFHGIPVIHVKMGKKSRSVFARLASWIGFHILSTLAGLRGPRPDVIICPSPPLTIALSAWVLSIRHGARYIYNVQEIYPDIAIKLGALRNKLLIGFFHALERFVYRKAGAVTVIGPGMRENLLKKRVPPQKVHVIPNFVDIGVLSPLPKDNEFSRAQGVHDKFVISYAGNMGPAQGLETFVEAAAMLRGRKDIVFMMMGNGILRDDLEAEVRRLGLENFLFLPQQPFSLVPAIYATSDINLVPLAAGTGNDAIPSKVYRIMACARPILACADTTSELAALVTISNCGAVVPPGNPTAMANVIASAADHSAHWRHLGGQGRDYVLAHYTRDNVTRQYASLVAALASR
jgi:colanic acid biosynthesis glycosyl transferase WcaI